MTINREKYDGVHFQVVTMNMKDGSVQGHAIGCRDLTRGKAKFAEPSQAEQPVDVETKADAYVEYNQDFLAEGSGGYDIDWLPCAKHVPAGDQDAAVAAFLGEDEAEAPVEETLSQMTIKAGRKWTYIYAADGSLIAEVRNDSVALVIAALQA